MPCGLIIIICCYMHRLILYLIVIMDISSVQSKLAGNVNVLVRDSGIHLPWKWSGSGFTSISRTCLISRISCTTTILRLGYIIGSLRKSFVDTGWQKKQHFIYLTLVGIFLPSPPTTYTNVRSVDLIRTFSFKILFALNVRRVQIILLTSLLLTACGYKAKRQWNKLSS